MPDLRIEHNELIKHLGNIGVDVPSDGDGGITVDITEDHIKITHIKIEAGLITELTTQ